MLLVLITKSVPAGYGVDTISCDPEAQRQDHSWVGELSTHGCRPGPGSLPLFCSGILGTSVLVLGLASLCSQEGSTVSRGHVPTPIGRPDERMYLPRVLLKDTQQTSSHTSLIRIVSLGWETELP